MPSDTAMNMLTDTQATVPVVLETNSHGAITVDPVPGFKPGMALRDQFGRSLQYMRISLTDACNLRCVYCMPENMQFMPRSQQLTDDEILYLAQVATSLGVTKIRLTGGEPTIRPGIVQLVSRLSRLEGLQDLAMTTNALTLDKLAPALKGAGLRRINVSLDTLDPEKFHALTRWGHIEDVWRGIEAAEAAGLKPLKLNAVIVRNFNDRRDMLDLAALTLERDWEVRFIEMMPFDEVTDFQQTNVVPFHEMRTTIENHFGTLEEVGYDYVDPSRPFRIAGARGTLGFISSVTEPFCQGCGRVRLTADGKLRLCLLKEDEVDLITPLRAGRSFGDMQRIFWEGAFHKPWGHDLERGEFAENRAMNQLGG